MKRLALCALAISQLHHFTNFELHGGHTHCVSRDGAYYEVLPEHDIHPGEVRLGGVDFSRHHQHGDCAICSAMRTGHPSKGFNHVSPETIVVFWEHDPSLGSRSSGTLKNRGPPAC